MTSTFLLVLLFLLVLPVSVLLGVFLGTYNSLRRVYEETKESLSMIQGYASKRRSVLADIRNVVNSYATHERSVHVDVAGLENQLREGASPSVALNALSRAYPELKSDKMFLDNQEKLEVLAEELRRSQARYDRRVREFNTQRNSLPTRFYAPHLGFAQDLPYSAEIIGKEDGIQILDRAYDDEKFDDLQEKGVELLNQSGRAISQQGAKLKDAAKDGAKVLKKLKDAKASKNKEPQEANET